MVELVLEAWTALMAGSPPALPPGAIEITGTAGQLHSRLPAEQVALACVATALLAARSACASSGGPTSAVAPVSVDRGHVATAVQSERWFRSEGRSNAPTATSQGTTGFAPLSRFWVTGDGWVRTHANYPWHRDALLSVLGTANDADAVGAALAERSALETEEAVFAAGGVACAVRTFDAWRSHPQGRAVAADPLIGHERIGDAPPRTRLDSSAGGSGVQAAAGIRVLDLTRVIAGPVCTRYLGAMGADVVRIDPPSHPDLPRGQSADSLLGKRSAIIDARTVDGAGSLERLLAGADVVVCGYRPGSLDRFGFDPRSLAQRHPGLVVVYLDAWGHSGPWSGRRGFDSVVQAPTGIARSEAEPGSDIPGALPCQLLDHGTGYLAAAAVFDGLRRQRADGGTHIRRVSLARTAWWLMTTSTHPAAVDEPVAETDPTPWLVELDGMPGRVTAVRPPGRIGDVPLAWPAPVAGYGDDRPEWRPGEPAG